MSKGKFLTFIGLLFGALLISSFALTHQASAKIVDADISRSEIRNESEAVSYLSQLCATRAFPNVVAAYPTNAKFNDQTGRMTYTINLIWRGCGTQDTRAFAVTGYATDGFSGLQTCASAGNYHNGWDPTQDCIKYDRSDGGILTGQSRLSCPQGSGYSCVIGGSNPSGHFRATVERQEFQPNTNPYNSSNRSAQGMYGDVPNWSSRSGSSGNHSFYRAQAVCTYAKINNQGNTRANAQCVSLRIDVSWTRHNYNLTPSISSPSDGTIIESDRGLVEVRGGVSNSGTTTSLDTEWRLTELRYNPSIPLTGIPQKSGGTSGGDPCAYFTSENACLTLDSGSRTYSTSGANHSAESTIGSYAIGTKICYALSVRPYSHTTGDWRHSALKCYVIGKNPKVQVWGGDLLVGRGALIDGSKRISNISTSITTTKRSVSEIDAPAAAFSGLYYTGVSNSNTVLPANSPDPHWVIDRVYRPSGYGGNTCQRIVTGLSPSSTTTTSIPTSSSSTTLNARVIRQTSTQAGMYTTENTNVTGTSVDLIGANNGRYVWSRVSPNARWIGQNEFGQNYSTSGCNDPTYGDPTNMGKANIYVFKLKDGFTIDERYGVKLDTVKLNLGGGFDNIVKFYVNGKAVSGWMEPGWGSTSTASTTATNNVFRYGKNELEIHVGSTYSQTGILIDRFTIEEKALPSDERMYGSWGEYGLVPSGLVKGMGSASAYAGGRESVASLCESSLLTFANASGTSAVCDSNNVGGYSVVTASPALAIADRFAATSSTPNINGGQDIASLAGGQVYNATGPIDLRSSAPIPRGKWVVINARNHDVTISQDIRYTTDTLNSVNEIPQVVIIARNIIIKDTVGQVDAWLVATGTGANGYLKTCDADGVNEPNGLTAGICGTRLTINGPVVAEHLLMYRTAGAEPGIYAGDPAEIFNLRPDAYLWASNLQSPGSKVLTVQTAELPPRF